MIFIESPYNQENALGPSQPQSLAEAPQALAPNVQAMHCALGADLRPAQA